MLSKTNAGFLLLGMSCLILILLVWIFGRAFDRRLAYLKHKMDLFPTHRPFIHDGPPIQELDRFSLSLDDFLERAGRETARLRLEKELLSSLLNAFADGVLCLNREGVLVYRNPALGAELVHQESLGKPYHQVIRRDPLLKYVHDIMQAGPTNGHARGPEEKELYAPLEFQAQHRYYRVTCHQVSLEQEAGLWLFIIHDETDQQNIRRLRQEFLQNAGHELKTPITSIRGYAETLLGREQGETPRGFLEAILRNVGRMEQVVEDMLVISAVESREYPFHPEVIHLDEYMDNIRRLVAGLLNRKEQQLELDYAGVQEWTADPLLLEHLLLNLITNASRYSPEKTTIQVRLSQDARRQVMIQVQDEGPGIAPEYRDKIFERFFRVDMNRSRVEGGTGLGLSIVRQIARLHGGTVQVDDGPEGGALFQVLLPPLQAPPARMNQM